MTCAEFRAPTTLKLASEHAFEGGLLLCLCREREPISTTCHNLTRLPRADGDRQLPTALNK